MDDYLDAGDVPGAIARLVASEDAQSTWRRYHLIGDIIRSEALAPCTAELGFAQRVMESLHKQSPALQESAGFTVITHIDVAQKMPSANAANFRIKAVAGTLVVCLVAFLLVGTLQERRESEMPQAVAIQKQNVNDSADIAVTEERPVMNRDPELDALLSAHEQMGGHSALQTPSGFLRNATFDRSKR
jgi:sigma-E factor negative regulatory protein RseA